jgi:hypothetical protein
VAGAGSGVMLVTIEECTGMYKVTALELLHASKEEKQSPPLVQSCACKLCYLYALYCVAGGTGGQIEQHRTGMYMLLLEYAVYAN